MDRERDQLIQKQKHRDTETKYPGQTHEASLRNQSLTKSVTRGKEGGLVVRGPIAASACLQIYHFRSGHFAFSHYRFAKRLVRKSKAILKAHAQCR